MEQKYKNLICDTVQNLKDVEILEFYLEYSMPTD